MSYQIKIPSCIFGGAGSIENVKAVIEKENAKKVIVFTDKGIRATGLLDLLTEILEENKTEYQVFDDLACEPCTATPSAWPKSSPVQQARLA